MCTGKCAECIFVSVLQGAFFCAQWFFVVSLLSSFHLHLMVFLRVHGFANWNTSSSDGILKSAQVCKSLLSSVEHKFLLNVSRQVVQLLRQFHASLLAICVLVRCKLQLVTVHLLRTAVSAENNRWVIEIAYTRWAKKPNCFQKFVTLVYVDIE